ncbi:MAG: ribokinase [Promethearchaeota archaeon]
MARKAKVVVIGSANTDMVINSEQLPTPGETVLGGIFMRHPGGKGANQAVAAARAGAEVYFIGKLGIDIFGDETLNNLKQEGIKTDFIYRDSNNASGVALIMVDTHGENLISVAPGSNGNLLTGEIEAAKEIIEAADILLLQMEIPFDTVLSSISLAEKLGTPIILNPAPAPKQEIPPNIFKKLDYLTPNKGELETITRSTILKKADIVAKAYKLLHLGVKNVLTTLGTQGSLLINSNLTHEIPAFPVKAIDAVGAGDCFNGCLATALAEGKEMIEAIRFASAAAAISVTRRGAQPSLPKRTEIEEKLTNS